MTTTEIPIEPKYPGCKCNECPFKDRQFVPPDGPDDAEVLFLGQAPARGEVRIGRGFSGPSGKAFEMSLAEKGLARAHQLEEGDPRKPVKVDNVILCFFEGGERPPSEAIEACRGHVDLKTPKVIVPMGNDALGVATNTWDGILRYSGIAFGNESKSVVPLTHPAFYIRSNPNGFRDFIDGMGVVTDISKGRTYYHLGKKNNVLTDRVEAIGLLRKLAADPPETLVVDLETDYPDVASATISCVSLAWDEEENWVIPWDAGYLEQHGSDIPPLLEYQDVFDALKEALEANRGITAQNALFDAALLIREGIQLYVRDDTMLMHYVLDERTGSQNLEAIGRAYFGLPDWSAVLKGHLPYKDAPYTDIPPEVLFPYAGMDSCVEYALRYRFREELDKPENDGPRRLYDGDGPYPGLMAICRMFIDILVKGVRMDPLQISKALSEMPEKLRGLEEELKEVTQNRFYNPGSYKDNRHYMFDVFKLPKIKGDSTDKDVLEALQGQHPFVDLLSEFRQYQKVCNTYMVNLAKSYRNGKGHPDLKLHGTVTGRLSANKLNPLVFPRESRGDLYAVVKYVFVADEGCFLFQGDYKGMEYRCGTVLSQDPWMMEKCRDPDFDVHSVMAEQIFGSTFLNADAKRKKELRVIAKMLVFGLNFGRGAASIGRQLGCSLSQKQQKALGNEDAGAFWCDRCDNGIGCKRSVSEAQELVEAYFRPTPMFKQWRDSETYLARTEGYLENPFGRRRRFPLITDDNIVHIRTQSVNTNTQSTANDCNLTTMYRLWNEMGDLVRPLWPIHDSIMMNVSLKATPKDVQDIITLMEETPQKLLDTDLPFFVDADVGFRWGKLKAYTGEIPDPDKELLVA